MTDHAAVTMTERAVQDIRFYGKEVLDNKYFRESFEQKHHKRTSVGDHTVNVSMTSLRMTYMLEKMHIRVNKENLVIGTLCHDLGILGRHEKFENGRECCHQHPVDSVRIAREIIPELNDATEKIIRRHMFPLTILPPNNREAVIVTLADKYCAVKEMVAQPMLKKYQAQFM